MNKNKFILNKKHAHRESSSNFSIEYDSYDNAFRSLIQEVESNDSYSIEYGSGHLKDYKVYNNNTCSSSYDEDLDITIYNDDPDFEYGIYSAWIGDFYYTIKEKK